MKVGIIGAGAWGTGLAHVIARGGTSVVLWSFEGEYEHFDGIGLSSAVVVTTDMANLEDCDVWIAVTPAAFFRDTMTKAKEFYKNQPIIVCTKGAEPKTGKFMTEILKETINPNRQNIGVLSGPQFAGEVAHDVPTGSTLAGSSKIHEIGKTVFNQLYLSYTDDVIGTVVCGVGKNAVALISGYVKIKGKGENESALAMTELWQEVVYLGMKLGAKMETFLDFCGLGDLLLTATSKTSRNFSAGMALALNEPLTGTVEGISALDGLVKHATQAHVHVPILSKMQGKLSRDRMITHENKKLKDVKFMLGISSFSFAMQKKKKLKKYFDFAK
ncbi:MAG: hypothetical protein J6Y07_04235 [Alphaproteobacteria bacterium]|nr:hypothetical protein [Alphaproteobacteria bacterium]